jgi:hypothetical protein
MVSPTARELVEAVREFLEADVLTATEGRTRFHARVAVNVLGMVERELASGSRPAACRELGYTDDAELARAIRAGDFDDDFERARSALLAAVWYDLRIANPAYLP